MSNSSIAGGHAHHTHVEVGRDASSRNNIVIIYYSTTASFHTLAWIWNGMGWMRMGDAWLALVSQPVGIFPPISAQGGPRAKRNSKRHFFLHLLPTPTTPSRKDMGKPEPEPENPPNYSSTPVDQQQYPHAQQQQQPQQQQQQQQQPYQYQQYPPGSVPVAYPPPSAAVGGNGGGSGSGGSYPVAAVAYPAGTSYPAAAGYVAGYVPPGPVVVMMGPPAAMASDFPVAMTCPSCHNTIVTQVVPEPGLLTWLSCVGLSVLGFVCGCCLIPFCIRGLQDSVHRCPACGAQVARHSRM